MCSEIIFDEVDFPDPDLLFITNYVINWPEISNEHVLIACSQGIRLSFNV